MTITATSTMFFHLLGLAILATTNAWAVSPEVKLAPRKPPAGIEECKNCHFKKAKAFVPGKKNPKLEHEGYSLKHGLREISCHSCHDVNQGEQLRSSADFPATFSNTSPVCQQCHALEYRDWSKGIHGRRTGGWDGERIDRAQLQCIECHDPHSVKFKKMQASAPPHRAHGSVGGVDSKVEVETHDIKAEEALAAIETAPVQVREFPCSKCHNSYSVSKAELPFRKLVDGKPAHPQLQMKHMENAGRCVLCHSSADTNSLNLVSGDRVPYSRTPELCGQCHGKVLHKWRLGYHGRQQIDADGKKTRLSCGECHNAHHPKFEPMEASAKPVHPSERTKERKTKHE